MMMPMISIGIWGNNENVYRLSNRIMDKSVFEDSLMENTARIYIVYDSGEQIMYIVGNFAANSGHEHIEAMTLFMYCSCNLLYRMTNRIEKLGEELNAVSLGKAELIPILQNDDLCHSSVFAPLECIPVMNIVLVLPLEIEDMHTNKAIHAYRKSMENLIGIVLMDEDNVGKTKIMARQRGEKRRGCKQKVGVASTSVVVDVEKKNAVALISRSEVTRGGNVAQLLMEASINDEFEISMFDDVISIRTCILKFRNAVLDVEYGTYFCLLK